MFAYVYMRVLVCVCVCVRAWQLFMRYVTLRPALPAVSESLCTDHIHIHWSRFEPVYACRILSIFW